MLNKIVLAGGSGYLGSVLAHYYKDKAKDIIILGRKPAGMETSNSRTVLWDAKTAGDWQRELEGADMLINLCGKNVNCRYTKENKAEIFTNFEIKIEPIVTIAETKKIICECSREKCIRSLFPNI